MTILYSIILIFIFMAGFILGLIAPFIIYKHFDILNNYKNEIEEIKVKVSNDEKKTKSDLSQLNTINNTVLNEWLNGGDNNER